MLRMLRAEPHDAGAIAVLIAEAFCELDVARWLIDPAGERRGVLAEQFHIHVQHAMDHGVVYATADLSGTAVWLNYEHGPLPPPADYDRRLAAACGPWTDRFQVLDDLFEQHHPARPHHHLAFLAVRPDRQGEGIGSLLLRHHLATLDSHGVPAYLEASSERSRKLYLRHGFTDLNGPFRLPDGPPLWPMIRPPQGPANGNNEPEVLR